MSGTSIGVGGGGGGGGGGSGDDDGIHDLDADELTRDKVKKAASQVRVHEIELGLAWLFSAIQV